MGEIRGLLIMSCMGVFSLGAGIAAVEGMVLNEQYCGLPIDAEEDSRLDAYVPKMKALRAMSLQDFAKFREFCDEVSADVQSGRLKPIRSSYHGEELMIGPKAQWMNAVLRHSEALLNQGQSGTNGADPALAVEDGVRVTALLDTIRFHSYQALLKSSSISRRALSQIELNLPKTKQLTNRGRSRLASMDSSEYALTELNGRARHQRSYYVARFGEADAREADFQVYVSELRRAAQRFAQQDSRERVRNASKNLLSPTKFEAQTPSNDLN